MNETLKAVLIEATGGNVRNHHLYLRGAFGLFPDDAIGGSNQSTAGRPVTVIAGSESFETDIDETKAIFRERGAIRRFFEAESVEEGDLVMVERLDTRRFAISKASKRGFKYYL